LEKKHPEYNECVPQKKIQIQHRRRRKERQPASSAEKKRRVFGVVHTLRKKTTREGII